MKKVITADEFVIELIKTNINMSVPHFLISSYLYYVLDVSIISDNTFDTCIVKTLQTRWDDINHRHKHLIDKEMTKSGFYLTESDYPSIVKSSALEFRKNFS